MLSVCMCIYRGLSIFLRGGFIEFCSVFYPMSVSAFWRRTKKNGLLTDILGPLTDVAKS